MPVNSHGLHILQALSRFSLVFVLASFPGLSRDCLTEHQTLKEKYFLSFLKAVFKNKWIRLIELNSLLAPLLHLSHWILWNLTDGEKMDKTLSSSLPTPTAIWSSISTWRREKDTARFIQLTHFTQFVLNISLMVIASSLEKDRI